MATTKKAAPKKAAAKKGATAAPKKSAPKKSVPAVKPPVADEVQTTSGAPIAKQEQQKPDEEKQQDQAKTAAKTLASKDAFEKLNSGKTIRRAEWPEGEHLVSENGNVFRQIGESRRDLYNSSAEDAAAEDWSVK